MSKLINIIKFIQKKGINFALHESYLRLSDMYYDKYFGVKTGTTQRDINDSLDDKESFPYYTIHYNCLFFLFRQISDNKSKITLLDYGCGKGRVITVAASYDFRKIIGVEFSNQISIAQTNLKNMSHQKTKNIDLSADDARYYIVPPEVNLIYFYNPFIGSILQNVIENIQLSLQKHPRKINIIYVNNDHFDRCILGQSWITKKKQGMLFPDDSYGLYESN